MKNAIFYLRLVVNDLLNSALLAILLAVVFTLLPHHGSALDDVLPVGFGIGVLAFRLDAQTPREMVTSKRVLVALLVCMWGGFLETAGFSIVGGHYHDAITNICGSLIWILPAQLVFWSAPEQWFGCNWRKVLEV